MEYRKYPKIHRIEKEEVQGILDYPVVVQEKVDGANTSIFYRDGEIKYGSRTRELPFYEDFRGFQIWIKDHQENLLKWFEQGNQDKILYGEWLVKHTINYPEERYKKFYLFDIFDKEKDSNTEQVEVKKVAEFIGAEYPHIFAEGKLTYEEIKEFVGQSKIAPSGEGVVIKSLEFVNQFGDHCYAKIVTENFKEKNNLLFGNNSRSSESYTEMAICNKYITLARIKKVIQKIESSKGRPLGIQDSAIIGNAVLHDMLTEEIWSIQKKYDVVSFKSLRRIANKKSIVMFHDILEEGVITSNQ